MKNFNIINNSASRLLDFFSKIFRQLKKNPKFFLNIFFDNVFFVIFIVCLIFSFWALSIGWNNTILDIHGFRQTQTAISVFYLLKGSSWLAYETPVLGPPWSIPFEFPLYQWLIAIIVNFLDTPLDQTGRFVSAFFFYLSLIPSYLILGRLNVLSQHRWIFLSLFVANPLYLFWSRTFLIESLAVFLSLAYLGSVTSCFNKKGLIFMALGTLFGTLAVLVKVTTFFAFLLAAILFIFWNLVNISKNNTNTSRENYMVVLNLVIPVAVSAVIPYLAIRIWVYFSDSQKLLNPIGMYITSKAIKSWNFGTLEQKLSPHVWMRILGRMLSDIWNYQGQLHYFIASILFITFLLFIAFSFGQRKVITIISGFLFLVPIAIFTNLHFVHNYYQYANCIFLVSAISFSILGIAERNEFGKKLSIFLLVFIIVIQIKTFFFKWYPIANANQTKLLATTTAIQKYTKPEDILLIYGLDWSPELPCYSQRRALMDADFAISEHGKKIALEHSKKTAIKNLFTYKKTIGAMVFCNQAKIDSQKVINVTGSYDFQSQPTYSDSLCEIYLPRVNQ
jgi:hypothetical protein